MGKAVSKSASRHNKQGFFSHFSQICAYSWKSLLGHPWMLTFLFVSNIAFLFLFSFYQQPLGMKINYTIDLLSTLFQKIVQMADVPGFLSAARGTSVGAVIMSDPLFQRLTSDLVSLFILLAAMAYIVYTFFQSTSVRLVGWMIVDKSPFSIWQFIKLNACWFFVYVLLRVIVLIADLFYTFVTNGQGIFSGLDFLYTIIHIVMFYLVFISYTFLGKKSSWSSIKLSIKSGFSFKSIHYYLLNYVPFLLYLIPWTKATIIAPLLNLLSPLGVLGMGLQLAILFFFYVIYVATTFTITNEVVLDNGAD